MEDFDSVMAAAKQGDETAFVMLFRSVQPSLLRYLSVLGGPACDDIASDTWVSVVRGLPGFTGDEVGWRAWVFTIAHARLRDAQRTWGRTPTPVDAHALLATEVSAVDVWGDVEQILSTEDALRLIRMLPRDQAAAVLLRHVVGLGVPDAAAVLGKQTGAVRVATHRALRSLATLLTDNRPAQVPGRSNAVRSSTDY